SETASRSSSVRTCSVTANGTILTIRYAPRSAPTTDDRSVAGTPSNNSSSTGHESQTVAPLCKDLLAEQTWVAPALRFLASDLGPQYSEFIQQWADAEAGTPATSRGLSRAQCPDEIKHWINKRGDTRFTTGAESKLGDGFASNFSQRVWKWWFAIQPPWRGTPVNSRLPPVKELHDDYKPLNYWGRDGWVLLLVCLKWWGLSIREAELDKQKVLRDDWLCAIEDMSLMLTRLTAHRD
ncbi:hypothetical protein MPER_12728, partial [Moniliophthora perniciosa FA553]